jgi:hypothetical protein
VSPGDGDSLESIKPERVLEENGAMSQISVTLVRADTNQEFDVELPDDAPISELLPALVKELGLPLTGPDGNQVAYELSNKRTGQEYKERDNLSTRGTKSGDVLLLTSTFVAGL